MEKLDIRTYQVKDQDSLFFDTNVWLLIYGPMANVRDSRQRAYSRIYKDALSRKAVIFISSQVVSEYINAVLRMGFRTWKIENHLPNADYKVDYRPTAHYDETLQDAKDQMETILKSTCRVSDSFHSAPISPIMERMNKECDYNDSYYLWLCKEYGYTMVSDDRDMTNAKSQVKLITY